MIEPSSIKLVLPCCSSSVIPCKISQSQATLKTLLAFYRIGTVPDGELRIKKQNIRSNTGSYDGLVLLRLTVHTRIQIRHD